MKYIITTKGQFTFGDFWGDETIPEEYLTKLGYLEVEHETGKVLCGMEAFKESYGTKLYLKSVAVKKEYFPDGHDCIEDNSDYVYMSLDYFIQKVLVLGFLTDQEGEPYYTLAFEVEEGQCYTFKHRYMGILDFQIKY